MTSVTNNHTPQPKNSFSSANH